MSRGLRPSTRAPATSRSDCHASLEPSLTAADAASAPASHRPTSAKADLAGAPASLPPTSAKADAAGAPAALRRTFAAVDAAAALAAAALATCVATAAQLKEMWATPGSRREEDLLRSGKRGCGGARRSLKVVRTRIPAADDRPEILISWDGLPRGSAECDQPVVVYFHGGGLMVRHYGSGPATFGRHCVEHGKVCCTVLYPLSRRPLLIDLAILLAGSLLLLCLQVLLSSLFSAAVAKFEAGSVCNPQALLQTSVRSLLGIAWLVAAPARILQLWPAGARHPQHAEGAAAAVEWCRRNAADFGGNPDKIVLFGHSSGGHLAAMLAGLVPEPASEEVRERMAVARRRAGPIAGLVTLSAPLDYRPDTLASFSRPLRWLLKHILLDAQFGSDAQVHAEISPLAYLSALCGPKGVDDIAEMVHTPSTVSSTPSEGDSVLSDTSIPIMPFLVLGASVEFVIPFANRLAARIFRLDEIRSFAGRAAGLHLLSDTVRGDHFSAIARCEPWLNQEHRFWKLVAECARDGDEK
eukprot:TRINITY_DN13739_c0_g1_i1.p1 TRINITY_DN13739_c0_g1~~TRINITY_DN13739_c0_g1_i1.p1  ORF type:complete len:526 (-),score=92.14 TRINITY_DN13739_c0_g1_i1:14-1591(-)